jgi:hypothetical protein
MELPQRGLAPTALDNNSKIHQTVKRNEGAIDQPRMLIILLSSNYATVLKAKKERKKGIVLELLQVLTKIKQRYVTSS